MDKDLDPEILELIVRKVMLGKMKLPDIKPTGCLPLPLKSPPCVEKLKCPYEKPPLRSKKLKINKERKLPFSMGARPTRKPYSSLDNQLPSYLYDVFGDKADESHAPVPKNYDSPVAIEAAEKSIPFFESIDSVIQAFTTISTMLESTVTTMQLTYEILLDAADNYVSIKKFMVKLYSVMASYKLVRWFLNKVYFLLRMVGGNKGLSAGENILPSIASSTQIETDRFGKQKNWPIAVFAGMVFAIPVISYKLLSLMLPKTETKILLLADHDWSSSLEREQTLPLVKGQIYLADELALDNKNNDGWIKVTASNGKSGYSPRNMLKPLQSAENANDIVLSNLEQNDSTLTVDGDACQNEPEPSTSE
ncbi:Peroxin 13, N-terminal,SH3 domain [Cinara cedri]|uniref:Peroxin 13, N-terminal,SH3 domain n=1 Tax=Cinara cedri TaxID=506608 RepID=A0A5E4M206_9HEMI|nr:Peroxin 13, N-terminal,SH3 domain [Cinara cedri]